MCKCASGYNTSAHKVNDLPEKRCTRCLIMASLQGAVLFFVLAHPETYKITGGDVLVHAIVFGLIAYLMMLKGA